MAKRNMKGTHKDPGEAGDSGIYHYSDPQDGGDATGNGPEEANRIIGKKDSFYRNVFKRS